MGTFRPTQDGGDYKMQFIIIITITAFWTLRRGSTVRKQAVDTLCKSTFTKTGTQGHVEAVSVQYQDVKVLKRTLINVPTLIIVSFLALQFILVGGPPKILGEMELMIAAKVHLWG